MDRRSRFAEFALKSVNSPVQVQRVHQGAQSSDGSQSEKDDVCVHGLLSLVHELNQIPSIGNRLVRAARLAVRVHVARLGTIAHALVVGPRLHRRWRGHFGVVRALALAEPVEIALVSAVLHALVVGSRRGDSGRQDDGNGEHAKDFHLPNHTTLTLPGKLNGVQCVTSHPPKAH